jgi:hypothetical protein
MLRALLHYLLTPCVLALPVIVLGLMAVLTNGPTYEAASLDTQEYAYRLERSLVPRVYDLQTTRVTQATLGAAANDTQYDLITIGGNARHNILDSTPELCVETWKDLLGQLKPGGILSYTIPKSFLSEAAIYRLISLGYSALLKTGVTEPRRNLLVLKNTDTAILIAGKEPFSDEFLINTEMLNVELGFQVVVSPIVEESLTVSWLVSPATHDSIVAHYTSDIAPPVHNRPFFFFKHRISIFWIGIGLAALVLILRFYPRIRTDSHANAMTGSEYIFLYLTTVSIVTSTLLIRLQSYLPLSNATLACGIFGSLLGAISLWQFVGVKSGTMGSRSFFAIGALVGFLAITTLLLTVFPLLAVANQLPRAAKMALVVAVVVLLAVATTWPVLGVGKITVTGNQIVMMIAVLVLSIVSNLAFTRYFGLYETLVALAAVMLVLTWKSRSIKTVEVPVSELTPQTSKLIVEEFHVPMRPRDSVFDLPSETGFPINENFPNPQKERPDVVV